MKGKKIIECRYGFPRPIQLETTLNTYEDYTKNRKRLYNLKRNKYEQYVNDYNPLILSIWRSNMDLQLIQDEKGVLNNYITDYITKKDKEEIKEIWTECKKNETLKGALKSYALQSLKNRQVGIYEVADKLYGHFLCEFSESVIFLPAMPTNDRVRRLKDIKHIKNISDENESIYHNNLLDHYYPNRPEVSQ